MSRSRSEAGVSAPATSAHLARLVDAGLISVEKSGRHRYHRLAGDQVAATLQSLAALAKPRPVRSLRAHTRAAAPVASPAEASGMKVRTWDTRGRFSSGRAR